jgi:hypothetical protein
MGLVLKMGLDLRCSLIPVEGGRSLGLRLYSTSNYCCEQDGVLVAGRLELSSPHCTLAFRGCCLFAMSVHSLRAAVEGLECSPSVD